MNVRHLAWVALTVGLAASSVRAESSVPARIQWTGNETYSADQILHELNKSPDFITALLLEDHRTDLPEVIAGCVRDGYRNGGFIDPSVLCKQVGRQVRCEIREGLRYRCGEIMVTGADRIPVEQLVSHLMSRQPADDSFPDYTIDNGQPQLIYRDQQGDQQKTADPVWKVGHPAPLNRVEHLRREVVAAINDLGFLDPKVSVVLEPDHVRELATMVIAVESEGTPATIDMIAMGPDTTQDHEAIIRVSGLTVGQTCTAAIVRDVTSKLWLTGRFRAIRVGYDTESREIQLNLQDKYGTPPIDEPLSELAELFLDAGKSLARRHGQKSGDACWEIEWGEHSGRFVSSESGILIEMMKETEVADSPQRLTFMIDEQRLLIDFSDANGYWAIPLHSQDGSVVFSASIGATDDEERLLKMTIAGSVSSDREPGQAVVQRVSSFRPSDWLPIAYRSADSIKTTDDRVILNNGINELVIDRESRSILQLASFGTPVQFIASEFQNRQSNILNSIESKTNCFAQESALTTMLSYLFDRNLRQFLQSWTHEFECDEIIFDGPLADGLEALIDAHALAVFDTCVYQWSLHQHQGEEFHIEYPRVDPAAENWVHQAIAITSLQVSPLLFAEEDWPTELIRSASLVLMGHRQHAEPAMDAFVENSDHGPLALGSLAGLMKFGGLPSADSVAEQAQLRMDRESFSRDLGPLLASPVAKSLAKSIRSFTTLSDEQAAALIDGCPTESAKALLAGCIAAANMAKASHTSNTNSPETENSVDAIFYLVESAFRDAMRERSR